MKIATFISATFASFLVGVFQGMWMNVPVGLAMIPLMIIVVIAYVAEDIH